MPKLPFKEEISIYFWEHVTVGIKEQDATELYQ